MHFFCHLNFFLVSDRLSFTPCFTMRCWNSKSEIMISRSTQKILRVVWVRVRLHQGWFWCQVSLAIHSVRLISSRGGQVSTSWRTTQQGWIIRNRLVFAHCAVSDWNRRVAVELVFPRRSFLQSCAPATLAHCINFNTNDELPVYFKGQLTHPFYLSLCSFYNTLCG